MVNKKFWNSRDACNTVYFHTYNHKKIRKSKLLDFQNGLKNGNSMSSSTENCIDISESVFNFTHCLIENLESLCEHNMHVNIEKKIRVLL